MIYIIQFFIGYDCLLLLRETFVLFSNEMGKNDHTVEAFPKSNRNIIKG